MSLLYHKALIFLLIFPLLLNREPTPALIAALILAVIFTFLSSYFGGKRASILHIFFCTASLAWPQLFPFLPLAAYDGVMQNPFPTRFLWIFPLLQGISEHPPLTWLSCTVLCILAASLRLQSERYRQLLSKYHQVRDDTTETAILLKQKNKELIKNQDYEIEVATLAERNRIAREIHDNVGHLLTRSILQVSALLVVHSQNQELKEPLSAVKATLTDAMDNVRQSVHDLHEESVDLKYQLTRLTEDFTFCPVQLTFDSGPLSKELNYTVIAIVREALSNIARHSNATQAFVSVLEHPSLYQLQIRDNGTVLPRQALDTASLSFGGGIGLSNMEERIRAFDGNFYIDCTNGFRIFISIPKRGEQA